MAPGRGLFVIALSFAGGLALTILPLPEWAAAWRPAWVAMILIYWCLALPQRVGIATGWCAGLLLDVLTGTLLGQHALGLSVVAFAAHKGHQRVRVSPPWQQAITVCVLVAAYQALVFVINGARGVPAGGISYLVTPLTSMLLWPWVYIVMRDVRHRFAVI